MTITAIICVSNNIRVIIHRQDISTDRSAIPVSCLADIESARQGGKVKGTIFIESDLINVIIAVITYVFIILAEIQRGQLVITAIHVAQRCIADIQRHQVVILAVQML